jgi:putative endonuclease
MKTFSTYILASRNGVLYIGVTNDLERRVREHKARLGPSFTARYNCDRLVWYETFSNVNEAIETEKRLKGWRREKKVALIEESNPTWRDLAEDWHEVDRPCRTEIPRVASAPFGMTVAPDEREQVSRGNAAT